MIAAITSMIGRLQFSSGPYLVFLALSVIAYYLLPGPRTRATWLLVLSLGFYASLSPASLFVLAGVILVGYAAGLGIEKANGGTRKSLLTSTIVVFIAILVAYKYLGFFAQIGNGAVAVFGGSALLPVLRLALPLGVSFWTFQSIAYVVDIYKGKATAERDFMYYLLAVVFFPVVTAGPITRVQSLVEQLRQTHRFDYNGMQSGLLLIGRGFFKKLLIADRLAIFVQAIFDDPHALSGEDGGLFLAASVFFAIQLYCDFSGYTDIVRGSARLFGVELPVNFRAPYLARTVADFWRRWHVTLMDWFKEYVYIPLGGSRVRPWRRYANVLTVFALSGLWHGAGLTYLIWGLLNGLYQVSGRLLSPINARLAELLRLSSDSVLLKAIQITRTFVLITIAWVFFRADSVADAGFILSRMFLTNGRFLVDGTLLGHGLSSADLVIAVVCVALLFASEWLSQRRDLLHVLKARPLVLRWAAYYTFILAVVIFGVYGGGYDAADFVYFKY